MTTVTEKYEGNKLDNLKKLLFKLEREGKPRPYEIIVDGLKVVPLTYNIAEFDSHEEFVTDDVREVVVLLFFSDKSPRNDKYIFEVKSAPQPAPVAAAPVTQNQLEGVDIDKRIIDSVKLERERWEAEAVKKELEDVKVDLAQAQEYIEKLQIQLSTAQDGKPSLTGAGIGEFLTGAVIGAVKENPKLAKRVPAGLAGLFGVDSLSKDGAKEEEEDETDEEPSYRKKTHEEETRPELSEQDKKCLVFGQHLWKAFSDEKRKKVFSILNSFTLDPSQIDTVESLISKPKQKEK
jgi:hypothetical protein